MGIKKNTEWIGWNTLKSTHLFQEINRFFIELSYFLTKNNKKNGCFFIFIDVSLVFFLDFSRIFLEFLNHGEAP